MRGPKYTSTSSTYTVFPLDPEFDVGWPFLQLTRSPIAGELKSNRSMGCLCVCKQYAVEHNCNIQNAHPQVQISDLQVRFPILCTAYKRAGKYCVPSGTMYT